MKEKKYTPLDIINYTNYLRKEKDNETLLNMDRIIELIATMHYKETENRLSCYSFTINQATIKESLELKYFPNMNFISKELKKMGFSTIIDEKYIIIGIK
jgi:hypothetical protein